MDEPLALVTQLDELAALAETNNPFERSAVYIVANVK